jgi:hypothetical protein
MMFLSKAQAVQHTADSRFVSDGDSAAEFYLRCGVWLTNLSYHKRGIHGELYGGVGVNGIV